jgi:hypothetical protein
MTRNGYGILAVLAIVAVSATALALALARRLQEHAGD